MGYEKDSYSFVVSAQDVEALRGWMSNNKVSQAELAKRLGTTQSAVNRWLSKPGSVARGDHAEKLEQLLDTIQGALGIPLDERVHKRLMDYRVENEMSIEQFTEFLKLDSYRTCINFIEDFHGSVDTDSYFKIIAAYINIVES